MTDQLQSPGDAGQGPYSVDDAGDGVFLVMRGGDMAAGPYAARKTALRKARALNGEAGDRAEALDDLAEIDGPLIDARAEAIEDVERQAAPPLELTQQTEVEVDGEEPAPAPIAPVLTLPKREAPKLGAAIASREDWLGAATTLIAQVLADRADLEVPAVRVACGWPSRGGTKAKNRTLGECWNPEASGDAHAEVFISPMENDALRVVQILTHELIHACLPKGTGHKGPFVAAAKAVGFEAPFTALNPSDALTEWTQRVVDALPAYPHAKINPGAEGEKKTQSTRMIKAVCEEILDSDDLDAPGPACGYQVRLTRKWIDEVGAPICPRCQVAMQVELPADAPEGDEEGGE
jgi:hypothetical protein